MRRFARSSLVPVTAFIVAGLVAMSSSAMSAALTATPIPARGDLDLAAMALVASDLPQGFGRNYGGSYYPGSLYGIVFATQFSPVEVAATGIQRTYEDFYNARDAPATIGIFIDEYETSEGATAGFALFEDESRVSADEEILSTVDVPAHGIGEEPSETSISTYRYEDGTTSQFVGTSFRIGNLNAGVWEERYTSPDEGGMPSAATPAPPDDHQVQDVVAMARALSQRMETVLNGETPPGIDPALAAEMLPLDTIPGIARGQTWEGFRDGPVVLGYEGSLDSKAIDVKNGYGRTVALGSGEDLSPPYIAVTLAESTSPEAARNVLDAVREAPGDLPTPGPFPRGFARDLVTDPMIAGADETLAFTSALNGADDNNAPVDSARVVFIVGPKLVSVDVQGVASADDALAAATDLANQQSACLAAGGQCTVLTMPSFARAAPPVGTPEA